MELGPLDANRFPHLREFGLSAAGMQDTRTWVSAFILAHPQIENLALMTRPSIDFISMPNDYTLLPNLKRLTTNDPRVLGSLIPPYAPSNQQRPLVAVSIIGIADPTMDYLSLMPSTVRDCGLDSSQYVGVSCRTILRTLAAKCPNLRRLSLPSAELTITRRRSVWSRIKLVG